MGTALSALGIGRDAVAAVVSERLGSGPAGSTGRRPFTPAARRVLGLALKESARGKDREIRAEHILLGLVADGGDAAEILAGLGAPRDRVVTVLSGSRSPRGMGSAGLLLPSVG